MIGSNSRTSEVGSSYSSPNFVPARMSSRWRTVQPSNDVPSSSGMYSDTSCSGSSSPRPTWIPATVETTDLVTDCIRCVDAGVMPVS